MKNPMDNAVEPRRPAWSRPEVVFITAALVLLGALLVPFSATVLAVIWVCTFCLAGAVTIICLAAGSSSDLIGFVPLASSAILLRLAALAAASRRITQQDPPDPLSNATGLFLAQNWPLGAILVCLLLAAIVSIAVFASSQKILLASTGYIRRILPLKRIGIETDMRMGVITDEQAQTLAQRIVTEYRFFAGMQGVATLIRSEIAIIVVVLLACVLMPALGPDSQTLSGQAFMAQYIPPVVGLAVFTLVPAVIAAGACGTMMSADTLALRSEKAPENTPAMTKKITIVARDSNTPEDIELLNPDFALHDNEKITDFEPLESESAGPDTSSPASRNAFEEALQNAQALEPAPEAPDPGDFMSCRNAEEYYEKISKMILSAMPARVLLAARTPADLPVTVAVNVAIRLAQKHKKVLLVDADTSRSALAQVFELDPRAVQKKAMPTCFENLSVCGVPSEKLSRLFQKSAVTRVFDMTLVYAPDTRELKIKPSDSLLTFYFSQDAEPDALREMPAGTVTQVPAINAVLAPTK